MIGGHHGQCLEACPFSPFRPSALSENGLGIEQSKFAAELMAGEWEWIHLKRIRIFISVSDCLQNGW